MALVDEPNRAELAAIARKALWLSAWTIHNANHLRDKAGGVKVGGHQASGASMVTLMAVLVPPSPAAISSSTTARVA